ncbi:MAG: ATP-dependent DNA ligase [Betaproteobacteria bacterium]|nr:MAG: ATP-dependent DNA ligase [Betaproteobacteria bacterium]
MLLAELLAASERVAATRSRLAKIDALAQCLRRLEPSEIALGVAYLSGDTRQGRIGIGYATLKEARAAKRASSPRLTLAQVDEALASISQIKGEGSAAERQRLLAELFARATAPEQDFLARLLLGELRQGALEGIMLDAIAKAANLPPGRVRAAAMRAGGLAAVAKAALTEGEKGLARFALRVFQPVQPMLAQPAEDVADALERLGTAAFEWKLDGARVQAHKSGGEIRVYTRSLNEVTAAVPEIVAALGDCAAREVILDGETIALKPDGTPYPFQETMRRFGRKLDVEALRATFPLSVFFFDCLLADGKDLTARPAQERLDALAGFLPAKILIPRLVTGDKEAAQVFYDDALARGHEGVMAKALDAPYEAGSRGAGWLKIKKAHTLDLAVIAAEWGSGRRNGWLSNLHLGALDPATGGFVMLGKTFKGMTDKMLAWQTQRLLELETSREGHVVHVRPALVAEVAFNEIQASPTYPGGFALRFARVKRYREDKSAKDADTIESVRALYEGQRHRKAAGPA